MSKRPTVAIVSADQVTVRLFESRKWNFTGLAGEDKDAWPDMLCFTGGEDVHPKLYNERKLDVSYVNNGRDDYERALFDKYKDVPKVGICRGGQFLNVMSGGAMWQDVNKHNSGRHEAYDLFGRKSFEVTSVHHQMMIPTAEAEVVMIAHEADKYVSANTARTEKPLWDIEACVYHNTNSFCVQGHPEYTYATKDFQNWFFDMIEYLWGYKTA